MNKNTLNNLLPTAANSSEEHAKEPIDYWTDYDWEVNDDPLSRGQYLVHLVPENKLLTSLSEVNYDLERTGNLISNQLDLHSTLLGFYSEFKKLGLKSQKELDSKLINIFNNIPLDISSSLITDVISFYSTIALKLDNSSLNHLHEYIFSTFTPLLVLKGSILPSEDNTYFSYRFTNFGKNFNPHLSLAHVYSYKPMKFYYEEFIGQSFYFDKILLSKKEGQTWLTIAERKL